MLPDGLPLLAIGLVAILLPVIDAHQHKDQSFWDDIEEKPRSLGPLGLQQGVHPCDRRRSVSEYQFLFPAVDFSLIDSDEDIWWKANGTETKEELATRGMKFMNWSWTRNENEIAIMTHNGFLFHTLNGFENDCNPLVKKEISKFANCEICSMVIVDRR
ncbi:phosphoglycerate mutase-like protein 1 [Arachis duranensis]|uniref:Phosphoglycerate mutase-like protein 1 n=1 Tax=Arachis duranensis TaxID=130453 RepID=A0A6P5NX78_ARADU|nr:phosphoglycerate mutase-like protein 1 [Arachis duranensis]